MLIILSDGNKLNFGTNSLFPDGNIPGVEQKQNEIHVRLHDDSDFAKQIMLAYDYELVLNEDNEVTDVIVQKTWEQYQAEQPVSESEPSELDALTNYVLDVDMRLVMVEMGLL